MAEGKIYFLAAASQCGLYLRRTCSDSSIEGIRSSMGDVPKWGTSWKNLADRNHMYYKTMQAPDIDYSSAIAFFIVILGVILSKVVNKIFKERDY